MNNVKYLTKVQLLSWFDINKARFTKQKKERRKSIFIIITYLIVGISMAFMFFGQSYLMASLSMASTLPLVFYTIYFVFSFLSVTLRGSSLYLAKDWEQNLSLPVSRSQILLSKILLLYFLEVLSAALFLVPCAISYSIFMPVSFLFPLWVVLAVLAAPILPLALGALLSILVNFIFLRLPFKNILSSLFGLLFVGVIIYFSAQAPDKMTAVLTDAGVALGQSVGNFFPLAIFFSKAFFEGNLLLILLFLLLSGASFLLFFFLLQKIHPTIVKYLQVNTSKKKYTIERKTTPPVLALLSKDLRHYFGSSAYLINTLSGGILIIFFSIFFLLRKELVEVLTMMLGNEIFPYLTAIAIGSMIHIGSITAVSISLEGSTFALLKSLPVQPITIFLSKILHQFLIFLPLEIIGFFILAIGLSFPLLPTLLSLLFLVVVSFLFAALGVIINIHFPKMEWTTEVQVIKQSAAVVFCMLSAVLIGAVFFALFFLVPLESISLRFSLCILTALILSALSLLYLQKNGTKKFDSIEI